MQRLLEFAVMVLAPLLVAVVIYRFAPSRAAVKGPFKGVSLNLQGAFAGCFAFMLLIFSFHDKLFPPPLAPKYEVWSVDGKIVYEDADPAKVANQTTILMDPPLWTIHPDGTFHAEFATQPGLSGSNVEFPVMHVELNDQQHDPVPLYLDGKHRLYETNQYTVHIDQLTKEIQVEKPVVLKRKALPSTPYNPSNAEAAHPTQEHQP
jgi:hypothetical protein